MMIITLKECVNTINEVTDLHQRLAPDDGKRERQYEHYERHDVSQICNVITVNVT